MAMKTAEQLKAAYDKVSAAAKKEEGKGTLAEQRAVRKRVKRAGRKHASVVKTAAIREARSAKKAEEKGD